MRTILMLALGAWLSLFAAACTPPGDRGEKASPAVSAAAATAALTALAKDRPLRVGVTLHPYYSWTKNVAGDGPEVEVRPILPGEVDAGNYQPRPEDIRKLSDLNRDGRRAKEPWEAVMAARKRKTLVVCQSCHEKIDHGNYDGRSFR